VTDDHPPARLHRVEQIMGMPIVLDVHDEDVEESALERAFDWLRRVDATFSTYRPDSEISRLNRGELELERCSRAVRSVLGRCERMRRATGGYFDHHAAAVWSETCPDSGEPGGETAVDPSGLVKGWSIDGVARILERAGARNYCAEAAGDMRLKGRPDGASHWRVGIQHPSRPDSVAAVLSIGDGAVATSGAYARGEHIVDPHTGAPPLGVLAVTIVGKGDLASADAYATATYAMGTAGAQWAAEHIQPYEALLICEDGSVLCTPGLKRWRN
jgi:FAD:protein FMN transferase